MTRKFLLTLLSGLCAARLSARDPAPLPLSRWKVSRLPVENTDVWRAINASGQAWQVYLQNGEVHARSHDVRRRPTIQLPFRLAIGTFMDAPQVVTDKEAGTNLHAKDDCLKVADGWLLWVDGGEWGGRVDWFSPDGSRHRHLSNDQITALVQTPRGIYAVQGLAHLTIRRGTFLKLRQNPEGQWEAHTLVDLKDAPYALLPEGSGFLIVTSTKLLRVRVSPLSVTSLYTQAFWWGMSPNSLVAAPNGDLFIGMRGGVVRAERTSAGYRMHWLTP